MTAAVNWTLSGSYETTDVDVIFGISHTTTVDVSYINDNDLPDSLLGDYRCISAATVHRCDHAHVLFHGDLFAALGHAGESAEDVLAQRSLACHETAHSLGLVHERDADWDTIAEAETTDVGCVRQDWNRRVEHVRAHNVLHINGAYP